MICMSIINSFFLVSAQTWWESESWLIIHGFTSHSRIFHLYGDVTIAGEGLQNLGLCSALRAFEQRGDLYRATPPVTRDLGFFGLIRRTAPYSCLLRHTRGCGGSILTRILTGENLKDLHLKCYKKVVCPLYECPYGFLISYHLWKQPGRCYKQYVNPFLIFLVFRVSIDLQITFIGKRFSIFHIQFFSAGCE
jgi:hypothetical protein